MCAQGDGQSHYKLSSWHFNPMQSDPIFMLSDLSASGHVSETLHSSQIDGLLQERCNSSALAMELRLSCINPLR